MLKNSTIQYGLIARLLHSVVALTVIGLFAVGLYMTDLTYYDELYKTAPHWHKSIGVLLALTMIFRVIWRVTNATPTAEPSHSQLIKLASHAGHILLYMLIFGIVISGYLISTADGSAISVFDWFEIPATLQGIDKQEDIAGEIHELLAFGLIAFAALHGVAALKHHVIDKDNTLRKMFGKLK